MNIDIRNSIKDNFKDSSNEEITIGDAKSDYYTNDYNNKLQSDDYSGYDFFRNNPNNMNPATPVQNEDNREYWIKTGNLYPEEDELNPDNNKYDFRGN